MRNSLNHQNERIRYAKDIIDRCGRVGICGDERGHGGAATSRRQCTRTSLDAGALAGREQGFRRWRHCAAEVLVYAPNTLPDFKLSNLPATTQSIAIILHDLDVAQATTRTTTCIGWPGTIPATVPVTQIEEGKLPDGAVNGRNGRPYMGMGAAEWSALPPLCIRVLCAKCETRPARHGGRPELLEAMKGKVVCKGGLCRALPQ